MCIFGIKMARSCDKKILKNVRGLIKVKNWFKQIDFFHLIFSLELYLKNLKRKVEVSF